MLAFLPISQYDRERIAQVIKVIGLKEKTLCGEIVSVLDLFFRGSRRPENKGNTFVLQRFVFRDLLSNGESVLVWEVYIGNNQKRRGVGLKQVFFQFQAAVEVMNRPSNFQVGNYLTNKIKVLFVVIDNQDGVLVHGGKLMENSFCFCFLLCFLYSFKALAVLKQGNGLKSGL